MNASVKGALKQINNSWHYFSHKGQLMTKKEVKAVLEYADAKGYKTTAELRDDEVDKILGLPITKPDPLVFNAVQLTIKK